MCGLTRGVQKHLRSHKRGSDTLKASQEGIRVRSHRRRLDVRYQV